MVSRYSFSCNKCNKGFEIRGFWWNQMLMHQYLDYLFIWHCILHHKVPWNKKDALYFIRNTVAWVPLVVLQIMDIFAEPFRRL